MQKKVQDQEKCGGSKITGSKMTQGLSGSTDSHPERLRPRINHLVDTR